MAALTLEEKLSALHHQRVLVIDDTNAVTDYVCERLSQTYRHVDGLNEPAQILPFVLDAIASGNPVNTLVLDMHMPQKNGLQVLTELHEHGINIPTVIFSAEQGRELASRALYALHTVENEWEFEEYVTEAIRETEGFPVTYVQKFPEKFQTLINAIDAVTIINQRTQQGYQRFIQTLMQKENAPIDNIYAAKMADLVKVVRSYLRDFYDALLPFASDCIPEKRDNFFEKIEQHIEKLGRPEYTTEGLGDKELGRIHIHDLQHIMIPETVQFFVFRILGGKDVPVTDATSASNINLHFQHLEQKLTSIAHAFEFYREASRQYSADRIGTLQWFIENELKDLSFKDDVVISLHYASESKTAIDMRSFPLIVRNVLTNAHQAMEGSDEKRVEITARDVRYDNLPAQVQSQFPNYLPDDAVIQVTFKDYGCGIPPENLDRIADEGFSTKGSTGFGMAFIHNQMRKAKGAYSVESTVGEGTSIHLYFPICSE